MHSRTVQWTLVVLLTMAISQIFAQEKTIRLKKGQVLSIIGATFHSREAQQKARPAYFSKVFPLAQKYSFSPQINFTRDAANNDDFLPDAFGIHTWNSQQQRKIFQKEKIWPSLKALRPEYWKHLRIATFEINENQTITFQNGKVYQFYYIWFYGYEKDQVNFEKYRSNMKKTSGELGGKSIIRLKGDGFEALNNDRCPDLIGIIEWPNVEAHQQYLASKAFQENQHLFQAAVAEYQSYLAHANFE